MVAYRHIQRERLPRRQQGIAYRRRYNNEIRGTTATRAGCTKGTGKDQKIAKTYRTIPVQIGPGVIPIIALPDAKQAGKNQKIRKANRPIAVEISRLCNICLIAHGTRGLPHA